MGVFRTNGNQNSLSGVNGCKSRRQIKNGSGMRRNDEGGSAKGGSVGEKDSFQGTYRQGRRRRSENTCVWREGLMRKSRSGHAGREGAKPRAPHQGSRQTKEP